MIVSFKSNKITTTANTTLTPVHVIGARLVSTTSADVIVHLHDPGINATTAAVRSTSASTRIATLLATNFGADELGYPVRVMGGTVVVTPTGTSTVYLFAR